MTTEQTSRSTLSELVSATLDGWLAYVAGFIVLAFVRIATSFVGGSPVPGPIAVSGACLAVLATLAARTRHCSFPQSRGSQVIYVSSRSVVALSVLPAAYLVLIMGASDTLLPVLLYAATASAVVVASALLLHISSRGVSGGRRDAV